MLCCLATVCLLLHVDALDVSPSPIYDKFYKILKPILVERVSGTVGNLEVQSYIKNFLTILGWSITEQSFGETTPIGKINFTNLIATFNPSAPKRYTLACHYDSKYFPDSGDRKFIGVTDSAVPCAMLLYLAFTLHEEMRGVHSNSSLQLIFFDGEEAFVEWSDSDSLYGSRNLVKFMQNQTLSDHGYSEKTLLSAMEIFILLDLIGHCNSKFYNYNDSPSAPDFNLLKKIELELCNETKATFFFECHNEYFVSSYTDYQKYISDDHTPFLYTGVKIIHMISIPFPKFWHTLDDDETVLCSETIIDLLEILKRYLKIKLEL